VKNISVEEKLLLQLTFNPRLARYSAFEQPHPGISTDQAPVAQRLDNAIHRINHYPADSVVCFIDIYPLDSDLSDG